LVVQWLPVEDRQELTTMKSPVVSGEEIDGASEPSNDILEARTASYEAFEQTEPNNGKKMGPRARLFQVLTNPSSSLTASAYSVFISACILASIAVLILESYYELRADETFARRILIVDGVVSVVFTIDYLLRLALSPHKLYFLLNIMNIFDLLSFVPFYVEIGTENDSSVIGILRVFRVFRVLRLLEVGRQSATVTGFMRALQRATTSIVLLFVILIVVVVLFGALMFYVETSFCTLDPEDLVWKYSIDGFEGVPTNFQNVPVSMWWAVVTVTTVGYGDIAPISAAGRVVAVVSMLCALVVVAFPVTILGAAFSDSYETATKDTSKQRSGVSFRERVTGAIGCFKKSNDEEVKLQEHLQQLSLQEQASADKEASQEYANMLRGNPINWIEAMESVNAQLKTEIHETMMCIGRLEQLKDRLVVLRGIAEEKIVTVSSSS